MLDGAVRAAGTGGALAWGEGFGEAAALRSADLLCAACHGGDAVQPQDELGDVGFCHACLDGARTHASDTELGGEA